MFQGLEDKEVPQFQGLEDTEVPQMNWDLEGKEELHLWLDSEDKSELQDSEDKQELQDTCWEQQEGTPAQLHILVVLEE